MATSPGRHHVTLDGSSGEGGGQILRSGLTLSLLTGLPVTFENIRANRDRPGLRPQHLKAVEVAAQIGQARTDGAKIGSRSLTFRPGTIATGDLQVDIGTAGSTALVLQAVHLALALRATSAVRLTLTGGTFNTQAPSFPFLDSTWKAHLAALGMPLGLAMPAAGFYPEGGGQLDAWIEPASPRPIVQETRGALTRIRGVAGVTNLDPGIAARMRDRAANRLARRGLDADLAVALWDGPGHGAAIALVAEYEGVTVPVTFVGLGQRGKPAEAVADDAVAELLDYHDAPNGAIDPHSADQLLLPLAFADGPSRFSVSRVTEHLRTNVATIHAFLDRPIRIEESTEGPHGRVFID
ncbi:RNA 3'-terminal phosphate cyclase [Tundrisphaera sp. TA3]|uniref:RNA 3'-terminal phosphate cyclase n=1 Tax=Tundrisphaera sp. TA3 TaxID=3435775 RepID=UPI003EBBA63D